MSGMSVSIAELVKAFGWSGGGSPIGIVGFLSRFELPMEDVEVHWVAAVAARGFPFGEETHSHIQITCRPWQGPSTRA